MYEEKTEHSPILPGATHILSSSGIGLEWGLSSVTHNQSQWLILP